MLKIGILNLQGDIQEHLDATLRASRKLDAKCDILKVKTARDVAECHGLIISGGESTVIGKLINEEGIDQVIEKENIAVLGTCAGMVILGKKTDYQQPLLGLIDMQVKRNGFGNQRLSFEKEVEIFGEKYPGIFIRAPYAMEVGNKTEILAQIKDKIVAVQEGNCLATAFHPELTSDTRIHEYFITEVI
jgi:pyridoxal 5'-phosphate synthase pdxT subunit